MIEAICTRQTDRAERVFFEMDNTRIGFCLYCTYISENKKCFIIDFCIYPQFRNKGPGKLFFKQLGFDLPLGTLLCWSKEE